MSIFSDLHALLSLVDAQHFFKDFIYLLFRERGREGERERNIDVREEYQSVASYKSPTGDLA